MSAKKLTATKRQLQALYKKYSASEIAKRYDCTPGAVYAAMKQMGIERRSNSEAHRLLTPIPHKELKLLYAKHTTSEIAKLKGVSAEWVRRLVKKYGIPPRTGKDRRTFNISKERLQDLYNEHSMREIAFMFGVGETVVFKRIKELGVTIPVNHRDRTGKVFSETHRANIRRSQIALQNGEKSPAWKGGITPLNKRGRGRAIYRIWKLGALKAAGNACERCGAKKGQLCECCGQRIVLHVHHKQPYSEYPELRYSPANAEVLCAKCHHEEHTLRKSGELLETP